VIASLEGVVGAVAFDSLVIEVGGIGYRVFASPAVLSTAQPGGRLKLHTYHLVREDQQALYGFRIVEELGFFTLLLTVTGVGPKVALAIVGSRPTAELQLAILQQDQAMLVAIPGSAEARRAGDLRAQGEGSPPRVAAEPWWQGVGRRWRRGGRAPGLGYSLGEAREAARIAIAGSKVGDSLEDRVKTALRALARD
jgi:Holliday junction DNA helicase RuvA